MSTTNADSVRLRCIKSNGRGRVKVISPGYNSDLFVSFPVHLRQIGMEYTVPTEKLSISKKKYIKWSGCDKKQFYKIVSQHNNNSHILDHGCGGGRNMTNIIINNNLNKDNLDKDNLNKYNLDKDNLDKDNLNKYKYIISSTSLLLKLTMILLILY